MRLALTLLVRDEIDVVDATIRYHLAAGVDVIVATDNGSVDGTRDVLATWARRGVLVLLDEAGRDFAQARWVTRMAQLAARDHGADWVVHADADELFVPQHGDDLKAAIAGHAGDADVLEVERTDFVPTDLSGALPPQAELYARRPIGHAVEGRRLPPKVIHRAHPAAAVEHGNHDVRLPGPARRRRRVDDVVVYHYPIRSPEQFARKVAQKGAAYACPTAPPEPTGWHARALHRAQQEGRLDAELAACWFSPRRLRDGIARGDLRVDERAARRVRALVDAG
jgi:hypothetical protein